MTTKFEGPDTRPSGPSIAVEEPVVRETSPDLLAGSSAHNCKPNAAMHFAAPQGTEWTCPCEKRWRKSRIATGWERVA